MLRTTEILRRQIGSSQGAVPSATFFIEKMPAAGSVQLIPGGMQISGESEGGQAIERTVGISDDAARVMQNPFSEKRIIEPDMETPGGILRVMRVIGSKLRVCRDKDAELQKTVSQAGSVTLADGERGRRHLGILVAAGIAVGLVAGFSGHANAAEANNSGITGSQIQTMVQNQGKTMLGFGRLDDQKANEEKVIGVQYTEAASLGLGTGVGDAAFLAMQTVNVAANLVDGNFKAAGETVLNTVGEYLNPLSWVKRGATAVKTVRRIIGDDGGVAAEKAAGEEKARQYEAQIKAAEQAEAQRVQRVAEIREAALSDHSTQAAMDLSEININDLKPSELRAIVGKVGAFVALDALGTKEDWAAAIKKMDLPTDVLMAWHSNTMNTAKRVRQKAEMEGIPMEMMKDLYVGMHIGTLIIANEMVSRASTPAEKKALQEHLQKDIEFISELSSQETRGLNPSDLRHAGSLDQSLQLAMNEASEQSTRVSNRNVSTSPEP